VFGRLNICAPEIVTLEQQYLALLLRQGVSEAVRKGEPSRMASFAKIAIGLSRDFRLPECRWLNDNLRLAKKIVEAAAGYGISTAVDHNGSFQVIDGGDATHPN